MVWSYSTFELSSRSQTSKCYTFCYFATYRSDMYLIGATCTLSERHVTYRSDVYIIGATCTLSERRVPRKPNVSVFMLCCIFDLRMSTNYRIMESLCANFSSSCMNLQFVQHREHCACPLEDRPFIAVERRNQFLIRDILTDAMKHSPS